MSVHVSVERLTKRYPPRRLFTELSFKVAPHSLFAITGRNGSGKSTLLKIIAGLVPPSSGQVKIHNNGLLVPPHAMRATLGMVAPDMALYDALSALENLAFFAEVRELNLSTKEISELLHLVGLRFRAHDLVSTFSSGMKQRLRFAYAMLHRPPLLILDEPTTNLDQDGSLLIWELILQQRQHGAVVLATNDAHEAGRADAVLSLD